MNNKKIFISLCFNLLIFALVTFATVCMLFKFTFMPEAVIYTASSWIAFKFFTVDSNVYAGIISLIIAVYQILYLKNKISSIPSVLWILKFSASVSLTLTFMTTVCFLGPTNEHGFFSLFTNSNLFYHCIVPVLYFISFVFYENQEKLSFKHTFTATLPMVIYCIYYTAVIIIKLEDGKVAEGSDWYHFLANGFNTIYIIIPLMLGITYVFSVITWIIKKHLFTK